MLPKESPSEVAKRIRVHLTYEKPEYLALCRQLERYDQFTMKDTSLWDLCVRQWIHDLDASQNFFEVSSEDARKKFQFWYTKSGENYSTTKLDFHISIEPLADVPSWVRS